MRATETLFPVENRVVMSQGNGAFKSMPTFETLVEQIEKLWIAHTAQAKLIDYLLNEVQEREYEITFLMNISQVVVPTSKIADANGKIPAVRKLAKQVYEESGREKIVEAFEARQRAEIAAHAKDLPPSDRAPEESAQDAPESQAPIAFPTGKVTH